MAKDPAFLFYPNDYLGGTLGMTFEEKGAYMELLMMQFNLGHLSESKILNMLHGSIDLWNIIKSKFEIDTDGLFFNARLELEQKKRVAYSESRRTNKDGKNQYSSKDLGLTTTHKTNDMTGRMDGLMEDEDRDKDIIDIKDKSKEVDFIKLAEYYNQNLCPPLSKVTIPLSEQRKTAVRLRAKEYGKEEVFKMLKEVQVSNFLLGENDKSWKAGFDWMFKPTNFLKIIEGNYINKKVNNEQPTTNNGQKYTSAGNDANQRRASVTNLKNLSIAILQQPNPDNNQGSF